MQAELSWLITIEFALETTKFCFVFPFMVNPTGLTAEKIAEIPKPEPHRGDIFVKTKIVEI